MSPKVFGKYSEKNIQSNVLGAVDLRAIARSRYTTLRHAPNSTLLPLDLMAWLVGERVLFRVCHRTNCAKMHEEKKPPDNHSALKKPADDAASRLPWPFSREHYTKGVVKTEHPLTPSKQRGGSRSRSYLHRPHHRVENKLPVFSTLAATHDLHWTSRWWHLKCSKVTCELRPVKHV